MDNIIQYILVAIASAALGVVGTLYFDTPNTEELCKATIASSVDSEVSKTKTECEKNLDAYKESVESAPFDYFKISSKLEAFNQKLEEEIKKKYVTISAQEKLDKNKEHYVVAKLKSFKKTKTSWFTSTLPGRGKNKLVLYFNYYVCDQNSADLDRKMTIKNSCYTLRSYSFNNDKWEESSFSANVAYFSWKDDAPNVGINLTSFQTYTQQTYNLRAFIPIPDEDGKASFLKYDYGRFSWEIGPEMNWVPTNEIEAEKFRKDIMDNKQT